MFQYLLQDYYFSPGSCGGFWNELPHMTCTCLAKGSPPWHQAFNVSNTLVWSSCVSQAFTSVQMGSRRPGVNPAASHNE